MFPRPKHATLAVLLAVASLTQHACGEEPAPASASTDAKDAAPPDDNPFPIIHTDIGDIHDDPALDECYEYVLLSTSMGDIILELHRCAAPITVENFLRYVDEGFYDDTIFHRVMNGFIIQGGAYDINENLKQTHAPIPCEWPNGLKNSTGTIAMARLDAPDTGTSQFFINLRNSANLDGPNTGGKGQCVFGRVVDGMDVVHQIGVVQTIRKPGMGDIQGPINPVRLILAGRILGAEAKALADKNRQSRIDMEVAGYQVRTELRWKKDNRDRNAKMTESERVQQGIDYVKGQGWDVTKGVLLPSGVWYIDDRVGVGDCPKIDDWVAMKWDGWLTWGEKFGSWEDRIYKGQPVRGPVRGFVPGYREALLTMRPGGVRVVVIPSKLAYGAAGKEPLIPADAALVYRIEMVGVLPATEEIPIPAGANDTKDGDKSSDQ